MSEKRIADLKSRLAALEQEINSGGQYKVQLHQQDVHKHHLSFSGGNGRIWISPNTEGYDISLSGKSLERQMYPFMRDLCERECNGYKQTNARLGKKDNPFWRVSDFDLVKRAVFHYASTSA
jgi:hypothetical protein